MKTLLLVLIILLPLNLSAATLDEVVAGVDQRYKSIFSLAASFSQEGYSSALKKKETSEGRVYFKKSGKMRWEYKTPVKDLIISNGIQLWVFQPDLKQVILTDMEKAGPSIARD
ncbi:MAG: outer membrane lipoprotein carrier protein LolA, partial [Deltaproteobacteria bacterium]|nr:outer membrane lipoprotein carrier protein LolA [Deltaproteobacteria bacterium]